MKQNSFGENVEKDLCPAAAPQISADQPSNDAPKGHLDEDAFVEFLRQRLKMDDGSFMDEDGSFHVPNEEGNLIAVPQNVDFFGEPMSDAEFQRRLGDAMVNDDGTWMEEDGGLRLDSDGQNLTQVSDGEFAGEPMSETEFQRRLGAAMVNDDGTWMGEDGGLHLDSNGQKLIQVSDGDGDEALSDTELESLFGDAIANFASDASEGSDNVLYPDIVEKKPSPAVVPRSSADQTMNDAPHKGDPMLELLRQSLNDFVVMSPDSGIIGEPKADKNVDDALYLDEEGSLHTTNDGQSMTRLSDGAFAGEPMSDAEFQRRLGDAMVNDDGTWMEEDGGLRLDSNGQNLTQVSDGEFAASLYANVNVPSGHTDQWYKKNPNLLSKEVVFMRKMHPKAKYGFYPTSGDMFWRIELKVGQGLQPWTVLLRYDKDHPNNNHFGGSIKVIPVKPTFEEIQRQARDAGRRGVPHILRAKNGGEEYRYLCTREQRDVHSGETLVSSAVMVAAWAAEWAAAFQLGLKRKDVWNKFCGETHFKELQEH